MTMGMGVGGIIEGFVGMGRQLAEQDQLKMQTRVMESQLEQQNRARALEDSTRTALLAETRRQMGMREQLPPPELKTPSPEEIAQSEGSDSPWSMKSSTPAPKLSAILMQAAESQEGYARAAAEASNVGVMLKHQAEARKLREQVDNAQKEERQQQQETWNNILQWTTAAHDKNSLNQVLGMVAKRYPDIAGQLGQLGLKKDADGTWAWDGTDNPKVIETLKDAALKQTERIKAAEKAAQLVQRQREAEDRRRDQEERAELRRLQIENQRENAGIRREALEAARERADERKAAKAVRDTQNDLNKDPVYGKFTQYQQAFDQAKEVVSILDRPNGYQQLKPSDFQSLAYRFNNLKEDYRSRTGGKYAIQEVEKFNGLMQKVDKWVQSIGTGTPIASETTARDIANTVTQLYDIANKNAVIVSLQGKEMAQKRGGDPEGIQLKGDLQRLFRTNQAKIEVKDNKRYLVIGREGQHQIRIEHASKDD
jgi:hypothetical protein